MIHVTKEQEAKLLAARSQEDAAALLKAEGMQITDVEANSLWEKICRRREQTGQELSLDELEAVSGGADRDWISDGCAATVEIGSWCWSNDSCYRFDVTYDHIPSYHCSKCGGIVVKSRNSYSYWLYTCTGCGFSELIPVDTETAE